MVFCTGCAGCGCVELGCELCALCEGYCSNCNFHTVRTVCDPAPHNHSQHNQCRTPYAVVHSLVLLKMGIMMPETWWDRSLIINIRLVASCWFLFFHPILCSWFWLSYRLIESHFIAMLWQGLISYSVSDWVKLCFRGYQVYIVMTLLGLWLIHRHRFPLSHTRASLCVCEYHVTPSQHGHI